MNPHPAILPVFSADTFVLQYWGGVSRYFAELHWALRRAQVDSVVAAPFWRSEHLSAGPGVIGRPLPAAFQRTVLQRKVSWRIGIALGAIAERATLATRRHGIPILHRTYYSARSAPRGISRIETVYDMIHETYPEMFAPSRTAMTKARAVAESTFVITISEWTRRRLLELYDVDPHKVVTVHLGVTLELPDPCWVDRLANESPFVLYVGSRHGYKNFERFLAAVVVSGIVADGLRVVAFGGGPPGRKDLDLIDRLGLAPHVTFESGSDATLAAFYRSAICLVYPSLDEGFGLPPLEAMGHGCPVASARAGAMPEILGPAAAFFDPTDVEAMAASIRLLASDQDETERLRRLGLRRAALYTWDATAAATMDVYKAAVARHD
jgi:glycosyltransferase involved in cell wall biosynthesis